ncbi:hypothetical protein NHN26_15920 [Rhodovulum tesquicola]|uniref:hypothetical protein n=1 Tax=Rhodovulum tesquicola TaxID=540254 RepID=UPI0020981789|nr:hypothetical protein [Rhodovulum tesquicola]MCO8146700.1 hypothetical protein [Rhodovulum tesquicola]
MSDMKVLNQTGLADLARKIRHRHDEDDGKPLGLDAIDTLSGEPPLDRGPDPRDVAAALTAPGVDDRPFDDDAFLENQEVLKLMIGCKDYAPAAPSPERAAQEALQFRHTVSFVRTAWSMEAPEPPEDEIAAYAPSAIGIPQPDPDDEENVRLDDEDDEDVDLDWLFDKHDLDPGEDTPIDDLGEPGHGEDVGRDGNAPAAASGAGPVHGLPLLAFRTRSTVVATTDFAAMPYAIEPGRLSPAEAYPRHHVASLIDARLAELPPGSALWRLAPGARPGDTAILRDDLIDLFGALPVSSLLWLIGAHALFDLDTADARRDLIEAILEIGQPIPPFDPGGLSVELRLSELETHDFPHSIKVCLELLCDGLAPRIWFSDPAPHGLAKASLLKPHLRAMAPLGRLIASRELVGDHRTAEAAARVMRMALRGLPALSRSADPGIRPVESDPASAVAAQWAHLPCGAVSVPIAELDAGERASFLQTLGPALRAAGPALARHAPDLAGAPGASPGDRFASLARSIPGATRGGLMWFLDSLPVLHLERPGRLEAIGHLLAAVGGRLAPCRCDPWMPRGAILPAEETDGTLAWIEILMTSEGQVRISPLTGTAMPGLDMHGRLFPGTAGLWAGQVMSDEIPSREEFVPLMRTLLPLAMVAQEEPTPFDDMAAFRREADAARALLDLILQDVAWLCARLRNGGARAPDGTAPPG